MAKVKKVARKAVVRNKPAPRVTAAGKRRPASARAVDKRVPASPRQPGLERTRPVVGRAGRLDPLVRYAVKALDPQRKCGPGTSVEFLYRVDAVSEGRSTSHLVFFDRHGWYCEHGRTCPAVAPARKFNGHIARRS